MVRIFVLAFILNPVLGFAHEVSENVIGRESHMMAHVMQVIFALSFAFCGFVVYTIVKDYQKKKKTI